VGGFWHEGAGLTPYQGSDTWSEEGSTRDLQRYLVADLALRAVETMRTSSGLTVLRAPCQIRKEPSLRGFGKAWPIAAECLSAPLASQALQKTKDQALLTWPTLCTVAGGTLGTSTTTPMPYQTIHMTTLPTDTSNQANAIARPPAPLPHPDLRPGTGGARGPRGPMRAPLSVAGQTGRFGDRLHALARHMLHQHGVEMITVITNANYDCGRNDLNHQTLMRVRVAAVWLQRMLTWYCRGTAGRPLPITVGAWPGRG